MRKNRTFEYRKIFTRVKYELLTEMFPHHVFGPDKDRLCFERFYERSPRIRREISTSFGMIVTRFAWIAHKLVSSKRPTR